MFYRRKIILALLQVSGGQIDKIRLQKLLFLLSQRQINAEYDFIPYHLGCYSFSVDADVTTMVKKGILADNNKHLFKNDSADYLNQLKSGDQRLLIEIMNTYGQMDATALIKHTYINYPFYAIKSKIAGKILTDQELHDVNCSIPNIKDTILFTIGYEGISLEEYLVRLIKNNIKVLIDVRFNPLSMKYGFNKSQLKKYCGNLNIKYIHLPELGIQSEQRKKLDTQEDYDILFGKYRRTNLVRTFAYQIQILNLLKDYKRIALTCFESDIYKCHRKILTDAIEKLPGFVYKVKHI